MVVPALAAATTAASAAGGAGVLGSIGGVLGSIGGIGNALGGIAGAFGKKKKPPPPSMLRADAALHHAAVNNAHWRSTMKRAKEYNIHPLTAMGFPVSASAPTVLSGSQSNDMGQNISRASQALQGLGDRSAQKALDALTLRRAQLENKLLESQITSIDRSNNPAVGAGFDKTGQYSDKLLESTHAGGINRELAKVVSDKTGHADGKVPLFKIVVDERGNDIRVYNEEAGDNEVLQALTAVGYSVPDYLYSNVTQPYGRALRKFVKGRYKSFKRRFVK
jgi:hypothetical protein